VDRIARDASRQASRRSRVDDGPLAAGCRRRREARHARALKIASGFGTAGIGWAFGKLNPLPNLSLRAPDEVYGQPIFDEYTGYDAMYEHAGGPSISETELAPGVQRRIIGHKLFGYNAALDIDGITFRVTRMTTDRTHEFEAQIENATAYQGGSPFENQTPAFDDSGKIFSLVVDFVFYRLPCRSKSTAWAAARTVKAM
jgi:hypothetical protein